MLNAQLLNQNIANLCPSNPIRIGARCITEINGAFFLLVEIEIGNNEQVLVIRISAALAAVLFGEGIQRCTVQTTIPVATPGTTVELVGGFVVGTNVYLVFDVENATDEFVLVRTPLINIIG